MDRQGVASGQHVLHDTQPEQPAPVSDTLVPKRVLVLSHAGVLEVNRAVFQNLGAAGVDVTMVVPTEWKGDLIRALRYEASTSDSSLRIVACPVVFSGRGSLFFYRSSLRSALGDWEPDLVFLDEEPWSLAALQAFLAFPGVPISFFTKENLTKWIPWPFSQLERWIYARAASAFAVSEEVEEVLRKKGFQGAIHRLHHSYDPLLFKAPTTQERNLLKKELGIPVDATVIGYFGRLAVEKGVLDLVGALQIMAKKPGLQPWFFLCVGNGPASDDMREALTSLPPERYRIQEALTHSRVGRSLGGVDILVLPSRTTRRWKEQYGRILIEAMACGAATVGSDSGEIPNLIARADGGVVFAEGSSEALASSLVRLLQDGSLLSAYRAKGRAYVERNLTHASVARDLAEKLQIAVSR
jgi:L-malate glycosyltransferase